MSVNSEDTRSVTVRPLRTADQYNLWKARVSSACWTVAPQNIFEVTDAQCVDATVAAERGELKNDWVGKCWTVLINSLYDDIFMKIAHIEHGHIKALIVEIHAALLIDSSEDGQILRVELYSTSMATCGNDLQSYIASIIQIYDKHSFLKMDVPQAELIHLFLRGLHPIFLPLQLYVVLPGNLPQYI